LKVEALKVEALKGTGESQKNKKNDKVAKISKISPGTFSQSYLVFCSYLFF